jgi:hypothetical protein
MAGPSMDNFTAIYNIAETEYQTVTGNRLATHPLAAQLDTCHTPEAIANVLRVQVQAFIKFRQADEKLMAWLDPIVHILCTFSTTLGEGIGLVSPLIHSVYRSLTSRSQPFSPAKTIFTGVGILLGVSLFPSPLSIICVTLSCQVVRDVVASHDKILRIFERIHFFLQRLNIYTGIPLTNELTVLLGKIMGQILRILALSTKAATERRMSELIHSQYHFLVDYGKEKFLKRLVGRTDVEDALQQLDTLTKEETSMTVARNLEVACGIDHNVRATKDGMRSLLSIFIYVPTIFSRPKTVADEVKRLLLLSSVAVRQC